MKPTTIIAFLAANFMVANAASTMSRIVIDLSNNDDVPSFHNDADFPDGSGLLNADNSIDSYDIDGLDNHASFFDNLADEPDELYDPNCIKVTTSRGGVFFPRFLFEDKCLLVSARPNSQLGFINYRQNCCGSSSWLRFNIADFEKLWSQGDLEGIRFQYSYFKDGERQFPLYKVANQEYIPITDEEFF